MKNPNLQKRISKYAAESHIIIVLLLVAAAKEEEEEEEEEEEDALLYVTHITVRWARTMGSARPGGIPQRL